MKQPLAPLLSNTIPLCIPVDKKLLEILCDTTLPQQTATIWYTNTGIMHGFNLLLKSTNAPLIDSLMDVSETRETIQLLVQATDAIILSAHHETHTWAIYSKSLIFEQLNAKQARQMLFKVIKSENLLGSEYAQSQDVHFTQIQS